MSDDLTRRGFLLHAARTALGVSVLGSLASVAGAADPVRRPTARRMVYLYMAGGMSHLDTFDPKPGTETGGPFQALACKGADLQIAQHLPKLAARGRHLAVVRGLTSTQGAHEQGEYFVRTSYTMRGTIRHPSMAAWLSHLDGRRNPDLPHGVVIGGNARHPGAGFLESRHAPLPLGAADAGLPNSRRPDGVDDRREQRRLELMDRFNDDFLKTHDSRAVRAYRDLYDEATRLMQSKDLEAFNLKAEPDSRRDAYGNNRFGQGCLLARRLIEHDVRSVEVVLGGWDTHDDNFDRVEAQSQQLDAAMSELIDDLRGRGLLDETLIVLATEFGRTPKINQNQGRDHYPRCFSAVLAGGGIRGGRAVGASDARGEVAAGKPIQVQDFNATIAATLGLPTDREIIAPNGRPFHLADKGQAIPELI